MKTRSNHIGGWRWRLRIFDWAFFVTVVCAIAAVAAGLGVAFLLGRYS